MYARVFILFNFMVYVLIAALIVWCGISLFKGIKTHGLKGIIEHVWEGEEGHSNHCIHTNNLD